MKSWRTSLLGGMPNILTGAGIIIKCIIDGDFNPEMLGAGVLLVVTGLGLTQAKDKQVTGVSK